MPDFIIARKIDVLRPVKVLKNYWRTSCENGHIFTEIAMFYKSGVYDFCALHTINMVL